MLYQVYNIVYNIHIIFVEIFVSYDLILKLRIELKSKKVPVSD